MPYPDLTLRVETAADIDTIHDLTSRAIAPMAISDGPEISDIRRLKARWKRTLSGLTVNGIGLKLGPVTLSPVALPGLSDWLGFGPISVVPAMQRHRIGTALVHLALPLLRMEGARNCPDRQSGGQ